jgi:hypothetical protein
VKANFEETDNTEYEILGCLKAPEFECLCFHTHVFCEDLESTGDRFCRTPASLPLYTAAFLERMGASSMA